MEECPGGRIESREGRCIRLRELRACEDEPVWNVLALAAQGGRRSVGVSARKERDEGGKQPAAPTISAIVAPTFRRVDGGESNSVR